MALMEKRSSDASFANGVFGAFGIGGDEGGDGVEGIEEEMRMNARFERGEARFDEQLVGAFLLHLLGAQFEGGVLQAVAQGFIRGDAEAYDEGDDEADGQEELGLRANRSRAG